MRKHPSDCIMEFFNFEPEEYQILEEIEVDETIQRPEKVRFYTLEDQLVDATEKMIPRDRRYTRFELEKIKSEVRRFEELYRTFVIQTIDGYEVQAPDAPTAFDWVFPAHPPIFERYVDKVDMKRIHQGFLASSRAPGYYPRLLSLLPKVRLMGSVIETPGLRVVPNQPQQGGILSRKEKSPRLEAVEERFGVGAAKNQAAGELSHFPEGITDGLEVVQRIL